MRMNWWTNRTWVLEINLTVFTGGLWRVYATDENEKKNIKANSCCSGDSRRRRWTRINAPPRNYCKICPLHSTNASLHMRHSPNIDYLLDVPTPYPKYIKKITHRQTSYILRLWLGYRSFQTTIQILQLPTGYYRYSKCKIKGLCIYFRQTGNAWYVRAVSFTDNLI